MKLDYTHKIIPAPGPLIYEFSSLFKAFINPKNFHQENISVHISILAHKIIQGSQII